MAEAVVSISVPERGAGHVRHLSPKVADTKWTEGANGCLSAEFTVLDPAASAVLTQDCKVVLSSPTSGDVLWTGRVARDGVQRSPLGESATVRCVGNVDELYSTRHWSLPYIVRDLSEWERETIKYLPGRNWEASTGARPVDPPWDSVVIQIADGKKLYPGFGGRMAYLGHMGSDMWIGSIRFLLDCGTGQHPVVAQGAPPFMRTILEYGDRFYHGTAIQSSFDTASSTVRRVAGGTGWPDPPDPNTNPSGGVTDSNYLVLATEFTDSSGVTVTNENVWMAASYIVVTGARVDRYGARVTSLTDDEIDGRIRAGDIVEDLIGRTMRGLVDPTLCSVTMNTWRLTQADWRDPSSPGEVLDDLLLMHPDHLWRLGKRSISSGLSPFDWRLWPTSPRYVVQGERAEVDLDGSPDPLYNSVTVSWVDWKGRPRSANFRANPNTYPDVADLQTTREAPPIDLDASLGEWETVQRIGLMALDTYARRIPAGTITVNSPILDTVTQELVPPEAIEAGTTIALSTDEPMIAHRIQEVTHEGTGVADITVGRPRLTLDQIVATRGRRRR